jgi:hypothetical protein
MYLDGQETQTVMQVGGGGSDLAGNFFFLSQVGVHITEYAGASPPLPKYKDQIY